MMLLERRDADNKSAAATPLGCVPCATKDMGSYANDYEHCISTVTSRERTNDHARYILAGHPQCDNSLGAR